MTAGQYALAQGYLDAFLADEAWRKAAERFGWQLMRLGPTSLAVTLEARPQPGVDPTYTLRLECEYCPALPPHVRFVNPQTQEFDPGADAYHVARLTAPGCYTHLTYSYPVPHRYGPQLVCNSLSQGYYDSGHAPTPEQRWDPARHHIGSSIEIVSRTLRGDYYLGRFG